MTKILCLSYKSHKCQRHYPCNAHCPLTIALAIKVHVGKMRAVPHTCPHILPIVTPAPRMACILPITSVLKHILH